MKGQVLFCVSQLEVRKKCKWIKQNVFDNFNYHMLRNLIEGKKSDLEGNRFVATACQGGDAVDH